MIRAREKVVVDGLALDLPAGRLSPSQVDMYLRCPLQYFWRYVEGLKIPPGVALVQGKSGHAAVELNNRHKIRTGSDLPMRRVVECFNDSFSTKKREIKEWRGVKERDARDEVVTPLTVYMRELAGGIRPVEAERKLLVRIGDVPAMIVVDLLDEAVAGDERHAPALGVTDFKVVGKKKSDDEAKNSLQLITYALARGVDRGRLISLVKGGVAVATKRALFPKRELRWVEEIYRRVAVSISRGSFPPCDPSSWICSPKWCGYYKPKCRGRQR